jgi:heat shock protein 4
VRTVNTPSGRLAFGVTYRSKEAVLLSEQVVAAFLHKLQLIMEIHKIDRLEPVVLSVPAYYNVFERRALLDAAAIGGMKVSRLINESTAVAIDYALNRRSEFLQNSPKYVLFVDFGHSKLSLTTISFTREKVAVVCQHN